MAARSCSCKGGIVCLDLLVFLSLHVLVVGHGLAPEPELSPARTSAPQTTTDRDLQRQRNWSRAAFRYISTVNCKRATFTTSRECQRLAKVDLNMTNIYLAAPSISAGKTMSVFPESNVQSDAERHDGVLAVDPYPGANFGHLVIVFYIDLDMERTECEQEGGAWLEENGDCVQLALQRRCRNSLMKRKRRRNFARRCEINFLPLVYFRSDANRTQQLVCRQDLGSLLPCPALRQTGRTNDAAMTSCDPLRENTKRCETTHEIFESACHVLKICDQAVILSGGWNQWTQRRHHTDNVHQFYWMLRNNGFHQRNIKVFYADGRLPPDVTSREGVGRGRSGEKRPHPAVGPQSSQSSGEMEVYPATESKMAMRYEIQRLCHTMHCVDSFVLYLNSPSTNDGNILLWDLNKDGVAEANERYSLDELMSDLADCQARHLHVIVDQSYSGNIIRAFRRIRRHQGAMVYASSKDTEYSYADEFTRLWTQVNHTNTCTKAIFKKSKRRLVHSTPQIFSGDQSSNVNIFGAPCDVRPPLTRDELHQNYLGCQHLPWSIFLRSTAPVHNHMPQSHTDSHHTTPRVAATSNARKRHRVTRH